MKSLNYKLFWMRGIIVSLIFLFTSIAVAENKNFYDKTKLKQVDSDLVDLDGDTPLINVIRYNLIGNSFFHLSPKLSCELVVLEDVHITSLKIVRVEEPKKIKNSNLLRQSPSQFEDYGRTLALSSIFSDIDLSELDNVRIFFLLDEKKSEKIKIIGRTMDGRDIIHIEDVSGFYHDDKGQCLK